MNELSGVNIQQVLHWLKSGLKHWYVFVLLLGLSFGAGYLYTHQLNEKYLIKTQVLLKSDEQTAGILNGISSRSSYQSYEETSNQMSVLKSHQLLGKVVDRLDFGVSYYIVGRLKTTELYRHIPFKVTSPNLNASRIGTDFYLNIISDQSYELSYQLGEEEITQTFDFGQFISDYGLYFQVDGSNAIGQNLGSFKNLSYKFRIESRDAVISALKGNLSTKNLDYTTIVELSLRDNLEQRAKDVLDTLGAEYLMYTLENQKKINENTLDYIDNIIVEIEERLQEIDGDLQDYAGTELLSSSKNEDIELNSKVHRLEETIAENEMIRQALLDLRHFLINNEGHKINYPPSLYLVGESPFLISRFTEWYDKHLMLSRLKADAGPDNISVSELEEALDNLESIILQVIENELSAFQERNEQLDLKVRQLMGSLNQMPERQRYLLTIERKKGAYERLYSNLLSKRAETEIAKAGLVPQTKIIEAPHSIGIVEPNKEQIMQRFLIGGFLIALIIVVVRIFLFDKIKSKADLSAETSLPILGEIFLSDTVRKDNELIDLTLKNRFVRSFRDLRAGLEFFHKQESKGRTMLVTSVVQGEGKTFFSANLATLLGATNKSVVLVDLDLHRPRIHKIFSIENNVGVTSILIGQAKLEEAIVKFNDNVSLMSSGPKAPNPSELIFHEKIKDLIGELKRKFDYVILDTPPVGPLPDALILSDYVDIKTFVLNSRYLTKRGISFVERTVKKQNMTGVNLVLNGVRKIRETGYYNHYYSRSGYYDYSDESR